MNALCHRTLLALCFTGLMTGCAATPSEETIDLGESAHMGEQTGTASQPVTTADTNWWRGMSQALRNWAIFWRANQDLSVSSPSHQGFNCKEWVRKVVLDATHNVVTVPSTKDNNYQWNSSPNVEVRANIYSVGPGDIIQMNRKTGPHTAIVYSIDGTTVTWIDSNWNLDNTVTMHSETIAHFLSAVTSGGVQMYTAYRITGG